MQHQEGHITQSSRVDVSIVVPVYNGEASLAELLARVSEVMKKTGMSWEVICVDDNSRDGSWEKLRQLKQEYQERLTAIRLSRNFGQNGATMCGLRFANGAYVVTMDDDLQSAPEDISVLMQEMEKTGSEVIFGVSPSRAFSWIRNAGARMMKRLFRHASGGVMIGSSFRLMTRRVADAVTTHEDHQLFLDQVIQWHTSDIAFCEVSHQPRRHGKSGYTLLRLVRLSWTLILNHTDLPLRVMTGVGLLSAVISFCAGIYFLVLKWMYGAHLGFTSLIVAIFFGTGVILFSLGIVGYYISRIYSSRVQKPVWSIRTKL